MSVDVRLRQVDMNVPIKCPATSIIPGSICGQPDTWLVGSVHLTYQNLQAYLFLRLKPQ